MAIFDKMSKLYSSYNDKSLKVKASNKFVDKFQDAPAKSNSMLQKVPSPEEMKKTDPKEEKKKLLLYF